MITLGNPQEKFHSILSVLHAIALNLNAKTTARLSTFGVNSGKGGQILFNCHYAAYTKNNEYYEIAQEQLQETLAELNPITYKSDFGSNYYQELAEFGLLLCHLINKGHLSFDGEKKLLTSIDNILADRLQHLIREKNLDRVVGALGLGDYFLQRSAQSRTATNCLISILDVILALREGDEITGYYWTSYIKTEPRIYTGLSHGIAMMISFLVDLYHQKIRPDTSLKLIRYATLFLLNVRMDANKYLSSFPIWCENKEYTINLCLVYGDLGTTYALIKAAKALEDDSLLSEATRIALLTINRKSKAETHIHDASILYGTSGTYLLYEALYQQTRQNEFALAANFWLGETLNMAFHNNEYQGFEPQFYNDYHAAKMGFGFGITGIGLTLLQAVSKGEYAINDFAWLS
jgi:lantibiotic biosynthesis protein